MDKRTGVMVQNWFGDIQSRPTVVARPTSVAELVAIVTDADAYPAPVRGVGSKHSTTPCAMAEGGTIVEMKAFDRIVEIRDDTVTAQAGALYIDVAKALQARGLQFYVNIELGNLTMGAAACTHTKDGSFPDEYGVVSSYAIGMKAVLPSGELLEVTEAQPELLQAMRTSFGLLGLVYEVTFRVKKIQPMAVQHRNLKLRDLDAALPALKARPASIMYYLFPFHDRLSVEIREYASAGTPRERPVWKIRNFAWKTLSSTIGAAIQRFVPSKGMKEGLYNQLGWLSVALLGNLRAEDTFPADQMIRYPEESDSSRYTFSIWAFPEAEFPRVLREYYAFCREHNRTHGYRCDMLNVGYRIRQDRSALLSYTWDGTVMTVDPVSTAGPGWPEFLDAYNEFCSRNGGAPLFNQTARLTRAQVEKAFGARLEQFRALQRRYDPANRFVNEYFADVMGLSMATPPVAPPPGAGPQAPRAPVPKS
jgi:FAD/FMN-containing dehydrogenase